MNLIHRNLKLKYRQSLLGIFWTLLIPALSGAVYYLVFKVIIKIQIPNYVFFILLGITHWTFFVTSLMSSTESIAMNHSILSKVPVPPHIFVLADVCTLFINFILSIPILIVVGWFSGAPGTWALVTTPILFAGLFLTTYFISLLNALIYVYFRDIRQLVIIFTQLLFYGTPILYRADMVPPEYRGIFNLNPLVPIFLSLQRICIDGQFPEMNSVLISFAWIVVLFTLSFSVYQSVRYQIVEVA